MHDVRVPTTTGRTVVVECCLEGCLGIWVDKQDVNAGLRVTESAQLEQIQSEGIKEATRWDMLEIAENGRQDQAPISPAALDLEQPLCCIHCGRELYRYRWDLTSSVLLDECPASHGTWFDGGEIMQMKQHLSHQVLDGKQRGQLRKHLDSLRLVTEFEPRAQRCRSFLDWLLELLGDPAPP